MPKNTTSPEPLEQTFWNGEPCKARRVTVIVGDSGTFPAYWARQYVGQERPAVEISEANQFGTQPFYIDNEGDYGWQKVTAGRGGPDWAHRSLVVERVVGGPDA